MYLEKHVTRIYFAVMFIGIIYAIYAAFSFQWKITVNARSEEQEAVIWNDQMETDPMEMTRDGDVYYFKRTLPRENTNEKVIVYNTVHMQLEVFIDGETVYELKAKDRIFTTTGFCWNTISLTEDDAGKEIVFKVTPVYSDSKPKGSFYYGTYREIEHKILAERILRFILAGIIALAGIVMLFYGIFVVKKGHDAETIVQFSLFATMLGIWSISETQILDWIFPCSMAIVVVSHLMLMTMSIPFMLFLRNMYHNGENRLWSICCYINCAVIALRVILQIVGMYDLRETLVLTHICLLLLVAVIVVMTIHEVVVNELTGLD